MLRFDPSWTLFLDRDGVINIDKLGDYIHTWDEFRFYPGAKEAVVVLSKYFKRTIVVTNQKGIGKGVTLQQDVETIHRNMTTEVEQAGGHFDAIYYCPDLDDASPRRKPNPGMALQAAGDFPDIDLTKSLMIGNNVSDLYFGRNAGMKSAFLRTTLPDLELPPGLADIEAKDLPDLLNKLKPNFH